MGSIGYGKTTPKRRKSAEIVSHPPAMIRTLGKTVLDNYSRNWPYCTGQRWTARARRECSPLPWTVIGRLPTRSWPASSGRSTTGTCGPAPGCPRSAASPQSYRVSRFTVVEAYDRLVAMGYLQSRRGAGFYATAAPAPTGGASGSVRQPQATTRTGLAHPAPARGGREHHARRRPLAAEFLARRGRHPPEPQRCSRARTALICSNTATRSAICRCASNWR